METICVVVEGTTPILLHRFSDRDQQESGKSSRRVELGQRLPRDIAGESVYRTPSGGLALPGSAFARLLREAGSSHKQRGSRKSLKFLVPAAVVVLDELVPLLALDRKTPLVDFEVDSRPVVIPATKGRIMRHRARLDQWCAAVNIRVDPEVMPPETVRQLMHEGVQRLGLGDFRPEKGGPFGISHLVAWEPIRLPAAPPRHHARSNGEAVA